MDCRIFLPSIIFFLVLPIFAQAYPDALYLLEREDEVIIIWSDQQVSVPLVRADSAIGDILGFLSEIPCDAKIIVQNVSSDYERKSREKIGKHEHEADYAYESLLLDTIAARLKDLPQKTFLVQGSSANVINEIVSLCLSSDAQHTVIFVDTAIAAKIVEHLQALGFAQKLTTC